MVAYTKPNPAQNAVSELMNLRCSCEKSPFYEELPSGCPACMEMVIDKHISINQDKLIEALIWCSGSPSFGPGGEAEEGWKNLVKPILDELCFKHGGKDSGKRT